MADDAEKTEDPTPKRKRKAKQEGNVAKSEEVSNALFLIFAIFLIKIAGGYIMDNFRILLTYSFNNLNFEITPIHTQSLFLLYLKKFFMIFAPIGLTMMFVGVSASIMQAGWIFTTKNLKPKFDFINIAKGFKQLFSASSYKKLVKGVVKILFLGLIMYFTIRNELDVIMALMDMSVLQISFHIIRLIIKMLMNILWFYLFVAIADYAVTKILHKKKLKMSKQEVKDERKQMEGDPQVRSQIRKKMQEESMKRMFQELPEADVVITNPIHLAVALRYKTEKDSAPKVIAKGKRKVAEKIKKIAKENNIPIIENKSLARLIYKMVKIGQEIPVDLYNAVAEILAQVYRMKNKV